MAEMQPEAAQHIITMHDPTAGETLAESHHAGLASSRQGLLALRSWESLKLSHHVNGFSHSIKGSAQGHPPARAEDSSESSTPYGGRL